MTTGLQTGDAPAHPCCHPLSAPLTRGQAAELAGVLRALADPARLQIVALVNSSPTGEVCACDLVEPLGLAQPTVSHHLKVLSQAGVLTRQQRGNWAYYSVCCDVLSDVASSLEPPRLGT
ncbi:MAG: helix-turn-helix transcriptional regulator [Acidimicrobiia bacterium]|nr:helix-turn-helix transcriptional regulator [Acidimicrobiia bacterium]